MASQSLVKSKYVEQKKLVQKYNSVGIDYFVEQAEIMLNELKSIRKYMEFNKFDNTIIHYAQENDLDMAKFIAYLHKEVYKGNYPYKEMMDPDYILENFLQSSKSVAGVYENKMKNKLCGCGIFQLEPENRLAYIRGLMILNEDRDYIDVKKIYIQHMYEAIKKNENCIDKIYGEVRTSHNIVQYLSESVGFVPHAILVNKDNFSGNGIFESDILAISYTKKCLNEKRYNKPEIHYALFDLYEYFKSIWNLSKAKFEKPKLNVDKSFTIKAEIESDKIKVKKTFDKYGYINYKLIHSPTRISMNFQVNGITKSAEKIKFNLLQHDGFISNYLIFASFILKLMELIKSDEINYFELYLPCIDANLQEIAMVLGCSVFGFAPAWHKLDNGKLVDCLICGKSKREIDLSRMKLTSQSKRLFELIKPFL